MQFPNFLRERNESLLQFGKNATRFETNKINRTLLHPQLEMK